MNKSDGRIDDLEKAIKRLEGHILRLAKIQRDLEVDIAIIKGELQKERTAHLATVRILDQLHDNISNLAQASNMPVWDFDSDPALRLDDPPAIPSKTMLKVIHNLGERWSDEELETLCLELDIHYEDLPGSTRRAKAKALAEYMHRHGRFDELLRVAQEQRPFLRWPTVR